MNYRARNCGQVKFTHALEFLVTINSNNSPFKFQVPELKFCLSLSDMGLNTFVGLINFLSLSTFRSFIYPQVYLSVSRSIYLSPGLFIYLQVYLSISRSFYLYPGLFIYIQVYLSIYRSIYLPPGLFIYIQVNLSISRSIYLSQGLFI